MLGEVTGLRVEDWWIVAAVAGVAIGIAGGAVAATDAVGTWLERRRLRQLPPAEVRPARREVEAGDLIAPVRNGRISGASLEVPPGWVEAARRVVRRGQWVVVGRVVNGVVVRREADREKGEA